MKKWYIKCPYCMEEILEWAKKCKHCGEFLDGRNNEKEEKEQEKKSRNRYSQLVYYSNNITIHCPNCDYEGVPEKVLKGNWFIWFLLYWFMIIPGIVYSIWRRSGVTCKCPNCSNNMLEITSWVSQTSPNQNQTKKMGCRAWGLIIFAFITIVGIIAWNVAEKMAPKQDLLNTWYNVVDTDELICTDIIWAKIEKITDYVDCSVSASKKSSTIDIINTWIPCITDFSNKYMTTRKEYSCSPAEIISINKLDNMVADFGECGLSTWKSPESDPVGYVEAITKCHAKFVNKFNDLIN